MDRPWAVNHYRRIENAKVSAAKYWLYGSASVYRTVLFRCFARQLKSRFGRAAIQYLLRHVFSKRGPMFESVPRTSARKPHGTHFWVSVDQKIAIRSVFVLAHARLDDGRVCQSREAFCHVGAHALDGFRRNHARLRIGVNALAVTVECDLEATRFKVRHAVHFVRLNQPSRKRPRGKLVVSRRHAKKEHLLAAGEYTRAKNFRKYFSQPRATGKNKLSRRNSLAVARGNSIQLRASRIRLIWWRNLCVAILHS